MSFVAPMMLWWLMAIAGLAILFIVRRRARRHLVTTLPFFQLLHRHLAESPWLRKLKQLLSFLLLAAIIVCATMAMARPIPERADSEVDHVIMVVDQSASTQASDDAGMVFARLQRAARIRLAQLRPGVELTLLSSAIEPEVLATRSDDSLLVDHLLSEMTPAHTSGDTAACEHLVNTLRDDGSEVWWFGDQAQAWADENIIFGISGPIHNAAIVACSLRRQPMTIGYGELFIQVQRQTSVPQLGSTTFSPQPVQLELLDGNDLLRVQTLVFEQADDRKSDKNSEKESEKAKAKEINKEINTISQLIPLGPELAGKTLTVRLRSDNDSLTVDDAVLVPIPQFVRPSVALVSGDRGGLVLPTLVSGDYQVLHLTRGMPLPEESDVVIYEGVMPPEPLPHPAVLIAPSNHWPEIGLEAIDPILINQPRPLDPLHPALFGVSVPRLGLAQSARLSMQSQLAPLIGGPSGVLAAAGYHHQQRLVVLGFDPTRSPELILTASWPSIIANALAWAGGDNSDVQSILPTGSIYSLDTVSDDVQEVAWTLANSNSLTQPGSSRVTKPISYGQAMLDEVGLAQLGDTALGVALLHAEESVIPAVADEYYVEGYHQAFNPWLLAAVAVLLIELVLCHRLGWFA